MEPLVTDLQNLLKTGHLQNTNLILGKMLQNIIDLSATTPINNVDLEPLLVLIMTTILKDLSITNANFTGILMSICYKTRENPEFWKVTLPLQDEIAKNTLQAIVILGSFSKRGGTSFIQQLQIPIPILIRSNDTTKYPYICQCFRRILKNTKTALRTLYQDINDFIISCLSSQNIETKIEAVKTLPIILETHQYTYKQLINSIDSFFSLPSRKLRYTLAKTLAKILYYTGIQPYIGPSRTPINDPKKIYKIFFNTILQYAQIDRNIPVLCHSMMIWVRFIPPFELSKKISLFVKFALAIVPFSISIVRSCAFSRTVFKAISSVIGNTYEPLICHYMYEESRKAGFSTIHTMMTLDTLINFRASTKTITKAAKTFYPLLATADRDIIRMILSFFVILGRRESKASQILVDSFLNWIQEEDAKPSEINGFLRGISILVMTSSINDDSMQKIYEICRKWLNENVEPTDERFSSALLLIASSFKRSQSDVPMQLILVAFRALSRLFKSGEKIGENDEKIMSPMKFGSILMKQIILSNSETLPSLYPTIQQIAISIAHNSGVLSAPTLLSLWLSIPKCKPAWHISLPQTMMNATPTILARFFSAEENKYDWGMRQSTDEVDICDYLYQTNLPKHYSSIVTDKMETIYTLLVADVRTPMRDELVNVVLKDYCAWSILSANPLKKTILSQLFSTYQEPDQVLFMLRLTLVGSIVTRPHIVTFIRNDALRVLFSFNPKDTRTIRVLGAAIAAYVNVNQEKFDALMEFIENPKINSQIISAVISELKFPESRRNESIRCMLCLQRLLINDPSPLVLFALLHLIENKQIPDEFLQQTVSIVEQFMYSDAMLVPENINYLAECIHKLLSENDVNRQNLAKVFCRFPVNKTFSMAKGLWLMSKHQRPPLDRKGYGLERPRTFLSSYSKFLTSSPKDLVYLIDLIQQGCSEDTIEHLRYLFLSTKNVNLFLQFLDQIIINGQVPFNFQFEGKICPSNNLIKAMMMICTLICQEKIEDEAVLDLIVSSSMEVLKLKDIVSHNFAIKMLSEFVFCYMKNPKLIYRFYDKFLMVFNSVFESSQKFVRESNFCLTFHLFLVTNNDKYLENATESIVQNLILIQKFDKINFTKISGKLMQNLNKPVKEIAQTFIDFSNSFITDVCKQVKFIYELSEDAKSIIEIYFKLKRDEPLEWPFFLILLREMEVFEVNQAYLELFNFLAAKNKISKDISDFTLAVVYRSNFYKSSLTFSNDIYKTNKIKKTIASFLAVLSSNLTDDKNEDTFSNILSMSLSNGFSQLAICRLLKISNRERIQKIAFTIVSFYLNQICEETFCLFDILFPLLDVNIIDRIISHVIRLRLEIDVKFRILRKLIIFNGGYQLNSMEDLSRLILFFFDKGGLEFLAFSVIENRTVYLGLNLLRLSIADFIFGTKHPKEINHKIIDFLLVATDRIRKIIPSESWEFEICQFCLNSLFAAKGDKELISHLVLLISISDKKLMASLLNGNPNLKEFIEILTPPKS
ncbi:hypothetical protein TVAG_167030 [Trichomonas vaginalis G3]|uniref:Uncharacterized protein n=1 Tax=Trichomonas vaginalis (strain ATCC PRA-98 / G3) TaxID=412133 RepID=A2DEB0_TRIV3|nr:armadillo (ARM) repeat-containing protein family [Trichomonas vaginalis G3]EAY21328.1 hypothetical protein TVAG_167030 [Trichomonas vaginalis G3]KAI5548935.1 armadillo (ARM) repeat-containing protein family [Trichomonas vaginalis G3]|eukprot:XP_001582314.1 hypothetical protein [Trichomonas vaginalis G3]